MGSESQDGTKSFRQRFLAREGLLGTILKTPAPHPIEIFGQVGFDFVMLDNEHGPFDRSALDIAVLASRAAGIPSLVRVADVGHVLMALDLGADGVVVPHVHSRAVAEQVAAACRYRGGSRGFANTTRAGEYGALGIAEHIARADASVTAIAMIEDPQALEEIDAIAAVQGIDGLFLGRGDLAAALGEPAMDSPKVRAATERIAAAGRAAGKTLCGVATSLQDAQFLRSLGVSWFLLGNDHAFIRQGAKQALQDYAALRVADGTGQ